MALILLAPDADRGVIDPKWFDMDDAAIAGAAAFHHGACDEGDLDPRDLRWDLVVDLPIRVLIPLISDWRGWYDDELAMFDDEHPERAAVYRSLMTEPLDDPIVVTLEPHRTQIWDGWHRTATRVLGGATTIPAIVGTIPGGPDPLDLMRRDPRDG